MHSYLQKKKAPKKEEQVPENISRATNVKSASSRFKLDSWSRKPSQRKKKNITRDVEGQTSQSTPSQSDLRAGQVRSLAWDAVKRTCLT